MLPKIVLQMFMRNHQFFLSWLMPGTFARRFAAAYFSPLPTFHLLRMCSLNPYKQPAVQAIVAIKFHFNRFLNGNYASIALQIIEKTLDYPWIATFILYQFLFFYMLQLSNVPQKTKNAC